MAREFWTVYRLYDANDRLLYVGCSYNFAQRIDQHCHYQDWGRQVASATCVHFDSKDDALAVELEAQKTEHPIHNARLGTYQGDGLPCAFFRHCGNEATSAYSGTERDFGDEDYGRTYYVCDLHLQTRLSSRGWQPAEVISFSEGGVA